MQHPAPPPEADRDGAQPHARRRRCASAIIADALRMAGEVGYASLGTFEFLVDADDGDDARYVFLEANPRLQVEHTVTEEVLGLDLVRAQLELAGGAHAGRARPDQASVPAPRGIAVQARVNMETMSRRRRRPPGRRRAHRLRGAVGRRLPHRLVRLRRLPHQHQLRLAAGQGRSSTRRRAGWPTRWPRPSRALSELRVEGVATNAAFLQAILRAPRRAWPARPRPASSTTTWPSWWREAADQPHAATSRTDDPRPPPAPRLAGVKVDSADPLAVLDYGRAGRSPARPPAAPPTARPPTPLDGPAGTTAVRSPLQGTDRADRRGRGRPGAAPASSSSSWRP